MKKMINANDMRKLSFNSINKELLNKALENCLTDIKEEAGRGCLSLERNAYSCYIGREDVGVKDALVSELRKLGFDVNDHQYSYWVGAIYISWR
jgi:hypothetical protein